MKFLGLAALLATDGAHAGEAPEGRVIDRVVAVVNGRALTQSQLELEVRISLIQSADVEPEAAAKAARAPLGEPELRGALDYVIALRLANDEADRLHPAPVDEAEVDRAYQGLEQRLGGTKAFADFLAHEDADAAQVRAILGRSLRAASLLKSRVQLRAQVSEAEVRRYYDEHPETHLDGGYDGTRAAIREGLLRARYQALIAQEITQARRTGDVRLVAPWARADGGEGS